MIVCLSIWTTPHSPQAFPNSLVGKESACNAGDTGFILGLGRSPGEGKGYPHQYSGLENSMDYPGSRKELDTTEQLSLSLFIVLNVYNTGFTSQHFLTVK